MVAAVIAHAALRVLAARPHRAMRGGVSRPVRTAVRWTTRGTEGLDERKNNTWMPSSAPRAGAGYGEYSAASGGFDDGTSGGGYGTSGGGYDTAGNAPPVAPSKENRTRRTLTTPDVLPVSVLVECAMLAALTGLLFHLSTLFRVDAWFGALFPLPVVIAAARHGNDAAGRVAIVTTLLLFILSGPLRAANYVFLHGAMALSLGSMWNKRRSWWITVPVSALVRSLGIFASLAFSSLVLRENVMKLLVTQMFG
jgi:hypothetical protein